MLQPRRTGNVPQVTPAHSGSAAPRGADSVYVELAARLGLPLVSWDAEIKQRASALVECWTPEELLAA
jgi:hypothetical protein